jgi:amino acid adenylation domain-containing protein
MQEDTIHSEFGAGIAIVGMSCILPGGIRSPQELWEFLCAGRDGICEVPRDRWNNDAVFDPDPGKPGKTPTKWGGFVTDIAEFDAAFFGISPREAAVMDPQQRMLLETAWRALEDAGIQVEELAGSRTGVYIGISHSDYHGIQKFGRPDIDLHTSTGGALSIAANRLSHRFDLRGPSLSIDTACSSSLVALDLACRAIRNEECEMALCGGVNAILTPDVTITFSRASMLSPDGRCKTFDARANGYVRGEGAGVVVLKSISRAIADGDRIHGVIRATAVNQDGRTTTITVPSLDAQVAMLREACQRAAINPTQVNYVEAHGTGTAVGDPIEAEAIGRVFGKSHAGKSKTLVGSIKSNIGHLEPAAGIAGLIKATLCVKHAKVPPNLHFQSPNPNIRFNELGIEVATSLVSFPEAGMTRIAAVNSFGFGGTNACAVVQQPPFRIASKSESSSFAGPILLPLSAPNRASLETLAGDLAQTLESGTLSLGDVAGTLAHRRSHLEHGVVILADSVEQAVAGLRSFERKEPRAGVIGGRRGQEPKVAFVFTGQGAHWWAMGRGLFKSDPVFRAAVEACDEEFHSLSGWSLISELMADQDRSRIDKTFVTQPTTFALQVGLAARWKTWGVHPACTIGHSIGEMAATYVAGAVSLADAVKVVYHRSNLQEQTRLQGGMAAIGLSCDETQKLLDQMQTGLEVAAVNAPELVTIAGPKSAVERFVEELKLTRDDIFARTLQIDYAFHSRQMAPFEADLRASLKSITSQRPKVPCYSTVTTRAIEPGELDADYWWRNMRNPVLFKGAVEAAIDDGFNTFVEIGAHPVLAGAVRGCLAHRGQEGTVVGSLHRREPDREYLSRSLAELHLTGVHVDWSNIVPPNWNFVDLPPQHFLRSLFWSESEESRAARFDGPIHPLLGYRLKTANPIWQSSVSTNTPSFLSDHIVNGSVVFPAAGYVELILAAARESLAEGPWELESVAFHDALVLAPDAIVFLQTSIDPQRGIVEIKSRQRNEDSGWDLRASGRIRHWSGAPPQLKHWQPVIEPPVHFDRGRFYRQLRLEGHEFKAAFQGVETIWREREKVLAQVKLPLAAGSDNGFLLHPCLLDSCFQVIRGFTDLELKDHGGHTLALPISIGRVRYFRTPGQTVFSRADAIADNETEIVADISIIDEAGRLVALIEGFCCRRVTMTKHEQAVSGPALYQERWLKLPKIDLARPEGGRAGVWLILTEGSDVSAGLVERLSAEGIKVVLVAPGSEFRKIGDGHFESPSDAASLAAVFEVIEAPVSRIVNLWPICNSLGPITASGIADAQTLGSEALIALAKAVAAVDPKPRLAVVMRGAISVDERDGRSENGILHASIIGVTRSIGNEFPELKPILIDIDSSQASINALADELLSDGPETEIALRDDERFGARLVHVSKDEIPARRVAWNVDTRTPDFQLTMRSPGVIDNLVLREFVPPVPAAGEVAIEVHVVGLNFRDVMAATGLLPAEAEIGPAWERLGLECAGLVRAVGQSVDPSLVGKRVVAVISGAFASRVCAPSSLVFVIPDSLSFAQAAAIPTAYATAHYALATLGRIQKGERILIHAATGGVGLAAVSVAKKYGADVIATAGSDEKRDYLRKIGIKHVFDSRSLDFADNVLAVTKGYGVDLVLNSLPGAFLEKGLSVLASGGRFLEIGKRDIYADTPIGLRILRKNGSFFAIDLAQLAAERPDSLRAELESVFTDLDSGALSALPIEQFPLSRVADAFRHMAKAKHIGKIVVSYDAPAPVIETTGGVERIIHADATYLVTGGTRGVGLAVAKWLVDRGARNLVLLSRSGAVSPEAVTAIEQMRSFGARVIPVAADVAVLEDVQAAWREIESLGAPLRGVFHAAGVIDDALLPQLELDRIRGVFGPKVLGAWNLHALTRNAALDFFVCFSSVAAHLGSVGQAHYAGANRALDAVAELRRAEGLPALSISWGAIGDTGFLTRHTDVAKFLAQTGVNQIPIVNALNGLGDLLTRDCGKIVFADVRWPLLSSVNPTLAASPRIADLIVHEQDEHRSGQYLRAKILAASEAERPVMIHQFLREQIATVLKVAPAAVEMDRQLSDIGLDSLTSFELKNRIEAQLGLTLAIGAFLQKPTAQNLSKAILGKIDSSAGEVATSVAADESTADLAMSIGQEALWFVEQFAPGSPAYGLAMCIGIQPQVDAELLGKAFRQVVARHDSLQMSFPADANGPVPTTIDLEAFVINSRDATAWTESALRADIDREANRSFDLGGEPLVRLYHYQCANNDILLLHVHHIVADASSIAIVVGQIFEAYLALRAGASARWPGPARKYANFVAWQNSVASGATGAEHLAFWRNELDGAPAAIALPTDFPRPPNQRGPGAATKLVIPSLLGRRLKAAAQEQGTTLFTLLLTAFNVLLHRLTGETDFVVGTPAGGRVRPEFEDAVGYLVNPIPIRSQIDPSTSFETLLSAVDQTVRGALEHQEFPFARIVRDLELPRDANRSPIFQVMFAMERSATIDSQGFAVTLLNTEGASLSVREFKIEAVATKRDRAQFDLTFLLEEFEDDIYGVVDYRTDLWEAATIDGFIAKYQTILRGIARSVALPVSEKALDAGLARPLVGPVLDAYPDVCDAIRQVAAANPARTAVEGTDGDVSYKVLIERADAIATGLSARGIGTDSLVGICIARSTSLVSAMIGVLDVGAAYLPIDLSHPPARLSLVLNDAQPRLIIADAQTAAAARRLADCPVVTVDELMQSASGTPVRRIRGDLAYVIHTSGSTGKPVGVEVRRDSLSSFLAAMAGEVPIGSEDSLLAVTTIAFDIAGLELLLPLTLGARVVVADDEIARDRKRLTARLETGDITAMQATPATWQMLLDAGWRGARHFKALVGGERLPRALANSILDRVGTLWNLYGPTETTIWSTCSQILADSAAISIGRPIANTVCYVVDENLNCVPTGVPGELLIGGRGLARGYRKNPELTAKKFIADPFDATGQERCFRTGDIVRLNEDGALVFLGRRDHQVKIRGFRVELGEIESNLGQHPAVRAVAAVLSGTDLANTRVAAFVAVEHGATVGARDLLDYLKQRLPYYMIPASVTIVESLPRLPNGKIDRARLASGAVVRVVQQAAAAAPRNLVEQKLLVLLKGVLGTNEIGIDDNFFEVGGTSLLGMRYLARVSDVFNVELGPTDLMHAASVASLAECIVEKTARGPVAASAGEPDRALPSSFWRPLALSRAEGVFPDVDAAAIAYLPDEVVASPLLKALLVSRRDQQPFWTGLGRTSLGTIALVVVPNIAREFFADPATAWTSIDEAIAYAERLGAGCASLTGLIPAATDLGRSLTAAGKISLTTGHAATASAMGLTIRSVLAATQRGIRKQRFCFVGLGSIGTATLRTVLGCLDQPASITLCDVVAKRDSLEALAREARQEFGFRGDVRIISTTGVLPRKAYDADVFICATNVPNVIAVDQLKPGSVIVDDSFPLCFDFAAATKRFRETGDIMFVAGGSVQIPGGVKWDIALPSVIPGSVRGLIAKHLLPSDTMITGCILSALLPKSAQMRPTIGEATFADCKAYWDGFARLKVEAARLHCGQWLPTAADIERFRSMSLQAQMIPSK